MARLCQSGAETSFVGRLIQVTNDDRRPAKCPIFHLPISDVPKPTPMFIFSVNRWDGRPTGPIRTTGSNRPRNWHSSSGGDWQSPPDEECQLRLHVSHSREDRRDTALTRQAKVDRSSNSGEEVAWEVALYGCATAFVSWFSWLARLLKSRLKLIRMG